MRVMPPTKNDPGDGMKRFGISQPVRRLRARWCLGSFTTLAHVLLAMLFFGPSLVSGQSGPSVDGHRWQTRFGNNYPDPTTACKAGALFDAPDFIFSYLVPMGTSGTAYACYESRADGSGDYFYLGVSEMTGFNSCLQGYTYQPDGACVISRLPVQACAVGHPVFPGTGTKILVETDNGGSTDLPVTRSYRSFSVFGSSGGAGQWLLNWQRGLNTNLFQHVAAPQVSAQRSDGSMLVFQKTGASWVASGTQDTLQPLTGANGNVTGWQYGVTSTGVIETYDTNGKLLSVRERNGRMTALTYNPKAQLTQVTAPSGRSLTFAYDAQNRVSSITAPDGAVTKYAYNTTGMLSSVTWPDNTVRQYVYEDARFPTALTGVIDEAGVRYATYAYDDQGRAVTSELTA